MWFPPILRQFFKSYALAEAMGRAIGHGPARLELPVRETHEPGRLVQALPLSCIDTYVMIGQDEPAVPRPFCFARCFAVEGINVL
jgi:hypothetical protein